MKKIILFIVSFCLVLSLMAFDVSADETTLETLESVVESETIIDETTIADESITGDDTEVTTEEVTTEDITTEEVTTDIVTTEPTTETVTPDTDPVDPDIDRQLNIFIIVAVVSGVLALACVAIVIYFKALKKANEQ